jgi:hypothetical protein
MAGSPLMVNADGLMSQVSATLLSKIPPSFAGSGGASAAVAGSVAKSAVTKSAENRGENRREGGMGEGGNLGLRI